MFLPSNLTLLEQAVISRVNRDFIYPDTMRFDPREYIMLTGIPYRVQNGKTRIASDRSLHKAISNLAARDLIEVKPGDESEDGRGKFATFLVRPQMSEMARQFGGYGFSAIQRVEVLDRYNISPEHDEINDGLRRCMHLVFDKIPMCENKMREALESGEVSVAYYCSKTMSVLLRAVEEAYPSFAISDAEIHAEVTRRVSEIAPGDTLPSEIVVGRLDGYAEQVKNTISY
jgi:hypothetical protein